MTEMHIAASPVWESWSELSTRLPRDLDLDELARTSHAIQRHRGDGVSDGDASTSKRTSTRVLDVFACCPPGPPEPEKRHSSSSSGIAHVPVTRSHRTLGTVPAAPSTGPRIPTSAACQPRDRRSARG